MQHWSRELTRARTVAELVTITEDYLAQWPPKDIARIPERCRPGRIKSAEDICFWYVRLAEEYVSQAAALDSDLHREMLGFFVTAAERVEVLSDRRDTEPAPPRQRLET